MGIQIEDGGGTGRTVKVNSEGQMSTLSSIVTAEHEANHEHGLSFNALFAATPAGADDVIFYLKNTSDKDMVIEGVWWQTPSAEQVYYKLGDIVGTAGGASSETITPANLNAGSGNIADVICLSRTADAAVDITGVSGGTTIQKLWLTSAATVNFNAEQDIIIPKNQVFTIYCVAGSVALRGTVVFYFIDRE